VGSDAREREKTLTFADGVKAVAQAGFTLPERWRPARLLGAGGQAEVWLAFDAELSEWVAVKVFGGSLTEVQKERLRREVRLGRSLSHPGLVRTFELIEGGDRLAVAMEWVQGESLARRVEEGPLPIGEVIAIAEQVLDVLGFLAAQRIVHRDVKPSNLLLDAEGRVRLADLGLIRPLADDADLTRTATTVGTPGYMSPEQLKGEELTPASDLYSLGITLYQLLTARAPFGGRSAFEVADRHLRAAPPSPRKLRPDCPPWLDRFVLRLLQKRPADRFRDAAAAREALLRRRLLVSPRFRRRAAAATLAVAAVAAGTIAAMHMQRREPVAVRVIGADAIVNDSRGRELWRRPISPETTSPSVIADLLGDRRPEVVLAVNERDADRQPRSRIAVFDAAGAEVTSFAPLVETLARSYPDFASSANTPVLAAPDLDGDGRAELVWTALHGLWYPSEFGVWSPHRSLQPGPVLANSGHLREPVAADLDGDGKSELVAVGLNNPMGFQVVLVTVRPVLAPNGWSFASSVSPDQAHLAASTLQSVSQAALTYSPLGELAGGAEVLSAGRNGILLKVEGRELRLDTNGNPTGSPLYGRGVGPRQAFWHDLATACLTFEASPAEAWPVWGALLDRHRDALSEPPMRLAAELLAARSLARGGGHAEAAALLRAARSRDPRSGDLMLRLGEQLFLAGHRREALDVLETASRPRDRGRTYHDAWLDLFLGAVLTGDERRLARIGGFAATVEGKTRDVLEISELNALRAFGLARWEDPSLLGDEVWIVPTIRIARLWAALERGGDPAALAIELNGLRANPEIGPQAALLQAELLRRKGELVRARGTAEESLATLGLRGRVSLEAFVWVPLGHRVLADILADLGERDAAAGHMRRAAELAPGCWFGR
jgi:serine/threonine-protein kinase